MERSAKIKAFSLRDIVTLIDGKVLTPNVNLDLEVSSCGAADLMSDVLAYTKPGCLLVTGLMNPQSIRTAEVADLAAIVFVRGKSPEPDTIDLAEEIGIPLIGSRYGMYEMCGRLYQAGLEPTMR